MRAITKDSNLFKEAIDTFNRNKTTGLYKAFETSKSQRVFGYLVLDFYLSKDIEIDDFIIFKSKVIELGISHSGQNHKVAFVSPVLMPERINFISSHLYTLALSAICSFAFERPVKSTRNDQFNDLVITDTFGLKCIGVEFPTTVTGINAVKYQIHEDIILLWEERLREAIHLLNKLLHNEKPKISYEIIMQSFRLIQLAHLNKKEDFDLGYSFLIAGIESISQKAIDEIDESKNHEMHNNWKSICKSNNDLKFLFEEYSRLKSYVNNDIKNRDLTKRFVQFLIVYNSLTKWEEVFYDEFLTTGLNARELYSNEISVQQELSPNNISEEWFRKIIQKTYAFRSGFLHTGLALPHTTADNSFNQRFFQILLNRRKINSLEVKKKKEKRVLITEEEWFNSRDILIKYELMSTMARNSIINYLKA